MYSSESSSFSISLESSGWDDGFPAIIPAAIAAAMAGIDFVCDCDCVDVAPGGGGGGNIGAWGGAENPRRSSSNGGGGIDGIGGVTVGG